MKRYALILVGVLLGLAVVTTASELLTQPAFTPTDYRIGDEVTNFRLKNLNGGMVSLSDFSDQKGVIIVFTCNHCPFSKAYQGRIGALHRTFAAQGFPVVVVNPSDPKTHEDDRIEQLSYLAKDKGYPYPYLVDDTQTVARAFGANRTPQAYVLKNTGGTFTVQYIGTLDDNPQDPASVTKRYVEDAVTNLLAGKPVVITTTKAIGCAIKWKDA
jgi:peroxiredoxin